jgi:hypothetical protein
MSFKYQKYLEALSVQCPPSDYTHQERDAFRFVFKGTHKYCKNNFLPVLIIKPARKNNARRFKKDSSKCQGYAGCIPIFTVKIGPENGYGLFFPRFHRIFRKKVQ